MLFNDPSDDIGYAFVRGNGGALKSDLLLHCKPACMVDMRGTTDPLLLRRQPVWFEASIKPMILAKNFDGIVWVENIHPPHLPLGRLLEYSETHYWRQLAAGRLAILLTFVICVGLLVRQRVLRRRISHKQ